MNTLYHISKGYKNYVFVTFVFLLSFSELFAQPKRSEKNAEMHVVIIAVSKFNDLEWENDALSKSILESCDSIHYFFETYFPGTKFHIHNTKESTTRNALRSLTDSINIFSNKTMTLVFIMSHGEPIVEQKMDGSKKAIDLAIITSNTSSKDLINSGFLMKKDFISPISFSRPGSMIVTFLDACQSATIKDSWSFLDELRTKSQSVKQIFVASTLANRKAYQTLFTQGLLSFWKKKLIQEGCLKTTAIMDIVSSQIRANSTYSALGLGPLDARAQVVIDYPGDLCLESFSKDKGLILFVQSPNRDEENLEVNRIAYALVFNFPTPPPYNPQNSITSPLFSTEDDTKPLMVERKKYIVVVYNSKDDPIRVDTIDFGNSRKPFAEIICGKFLNLNKLGEAFEKGAQFAFDAGLPAGAVQELRKKSYASYFSADNIEGADRVAGTILSQSPLDDPWRVAYQLKHIETVSEKFDTLRKKIDNLSKLRSYAVQFLRTGDFNSAANLLLKAAENAPTKEASKAFAIHAYYSFGAASRPEKAKAIREKYNIKPSKYILQIESLALKKSDSNDDKNEYKNRSLIMSLTVPLAVPARLGLGVPAKLAKGGQGFDF